jgi:hydroxymethylglutaryl-CoA lyase
LKKKEDRVTIVDVSPRDGLPAVCGGASTADKIMYINSLTNAGLKKIECVAFTHPRLIPENADAEKIMAGISKRPDVTYIGLVSNEIGCRRALAAGIDEILTLVATSDTYNQLSVGKSKRETLHKVLPSIIEASNKTDKPVRCYIQTAFGCPYTGRVSLEDVLQLFLKLTYMGAKEIVLLDSTGMANPKQVREYVKKILDLDTGVNLAVHFHNTRGTAIANCMAAYDVGIRTFYTSIGGLSGTPYGAKELDFGYWNVPTEDLVHLLHEMGVDTGLDMDLLLECVKIAETLAGKPLPGHLLRANLNSRLADIPNPSKMLTYRQLQ